MYLKFSRTGVLLSSLLLLGSLARAQSTNNGAQQPLPPVSPLGPVKTVGDSMTPEDSSTGGNPSWIPDSRPLAGAQELRLGIPASAHSFLLPSFSAITQVGSNGYNSRPGTTNTAGTLSTSLLTGRLGMNRISRGSELLLDYLGGASFSNDPRLGNSLIQGLDVSETFRWSRWSVLLADKSSYLSNSPFGFGGVGGLKNLGVSLGNGVGSSPGISSSFAPGQSIYINGTPRINNTGLGQTSYLLSHRSALTFIGSYASLYFMDGLLLNSKAISVQGGYEYQLSRENAITAIYRYDDFNYSNSVPSIHVQSLQVSIARRITGRLSWLMGAGPSLQEYQKPLSGTGTVVSPIVNASLMYRWRYTGAGLNYSHGMTSGSGVLPGAETDTFSGQATRTFGKNWDCSIDGGFSRNQAVRQTQALTKGTSPQTWFTTVRVNRRFVGYGALFLSFNASGQSSLSALCTLPGCSTKAVVSTGSVGYTWGLRPVVMR